MPIYDLNESFIKHFKITSFFQKEKRGGQKTVYFPEIDGIKYAMKIHNVTGVDERMTRELNIYDKYKGMDGIPSIFSIDSYDTELVIFEQFVEGDVLCDIADRFRGDSNGISTLIKALVVIMTKIWRDDLVHRDIKPQNIIIRKSGKPVLLDFGIARDLFEATLTDTGFQPFSWPFGSPEQFAGEKEQISMRTDFFSLGVLGYFLYYGAYPFGDTKDAIHEKFRSKVDGFFLKDKDPLNDFFKETMKISPTERPRTIEDFLKLLP